VTPALALHLGGLRKTYGGVDALAGLDMRVREGEVYGLLGRNGAGKSTALRIAMGITRASQGEVALFGQRIKPGDTLAKRAIGYVAQEQSFYGWMTARSIGRFVSGFYPGWDDDEYVRLLDLLELPAQRRLDGFSGGMRAKLALALALAHRPRLLLLDEPTAGMDPVARREFIEIVRDHAQRTQRTTVFSSHLIDEVELAADTVGIVHEGAMLYEGSVASLRASIRSFSHPLVDGIAPTLPGVDGQPLPGIQVLQDRIYAGERQLILRGASPQALLAIAFVAMVSRAVSL
jgi:ABC-2 type transport system ATP-binding protein